VRRDIFIGIDELLTLLHFVKGEFPGKVGRDEERVDLIKHLLRMYVCMYSFFIGGPVNRKLHNERRGGRRRRRGGREGRITLGTHPYMLWKFWRGGERGLSTYYIFNHVLLSMAFYLQ